MVIILLVVMFVLECIQFCITLSRHGSFDKIYLKIVSLIATSQKLMLGIEPKKHLEENCFQNVHLGKYIVGYTVGKHDFRLYVSDDIHVPP